LGERRGRSGLKEGEGGKDGRRGGEKKRETDTQTHTRSQHTSPKHGESTHTTVHTRSHTGTPHEDSRPTKERRESSHTHTSTAECGLTMVGWQSQDARNPGGGEGERKAGNMPEAPLVRRMQRPPEEMAGEGTKKKNLPTAPLVRRMQRPREKWPRGARKERPAGRGGRAPGGGRRGGRAESLCQEFSACAADLVRPHCSASRVEQKRHAYSVLFSSQHGASEILHESRRRL